MNRLLDKRVLTDECEVDKSALLSKDIVHNLRELVIYVVFKTGCVGGVVLVEGAHDDSFAGEWATLGTVTWTKASKTHLVAITGCHKAIRIRIAEAIKSGFIDVYVVAN